MDNTNPTTAERARYIDPTLAAGFSVVGYFCQTDPRAAFARNQKRVGRARIRTAGLFGTAKRLEIPSLPEGFHRIDRVESVEPAGFRVAPWLTVAPPRHPNDHDHANSASDPGRP